MRKEVGVELLLLGIVFVDKTTGVFSPDNYLKREVDLIS
jgi:hypothetical protein